MTNDIDPKTDDAETATNDIEQSIDGNTPSETTGPRPPFDQRLVETTSERDSGDQSRSQDGVQSPTSVVDSTTDSGFQFPLERRHVIASALAAFGLAGAGTAQARHGNNGQGNGQNQGDIDIKTGTVSHDSPGAADDGTWNTYEVDQQSVEFVDSFETPPVVFIGSTSYTTIGMFRAIDVTETGFESRWMVYQSESFAAPDAQWVAMGQS